MTHEPFEDDVPDDETPDDKELNQLIDLALTDARPDRYDAGDREWAEDVVKMAAKELKGRLDRDELIEDSARRRVNQREGQATKRANKVLRNIAETGALPIGWGEGEDWKEFLAEALNSPLSIDRERVRLGAASPGDLEQWELVNAREEDKRKLAQINTRKGGRMLADWMRAQSVQRVEDLSGNPAAGGA